MASFHPMRLTGWGRFPAETCNLFRPEKQRDIEVALVDGDQPHYISRGLGRSYGDAALNAESGVISHVRLNRFLSFDPKTAILECEAGVSFAEIGDVFLPRGYFAPVTPGTKFVTIGGAIAADVHGKNHHRDGTIAGFVVDMTLLLPSGAVMVCSPTVQERVFWATVGGMGLTGIILSARLQLRRVESAYILVDYEKSADLDGALRAFADTDESYQYSMAWMDCLARGRSLGRSVLMRGNHAPAARVVRDRQPLTPPRKRVLGIPFAPPFGVLNRLTVGPFNAVYYRQHRDRTNQLVNVDSFFYPLDSIHHWNRLYGKRGFVQYQVAFPLEGGREALIALLERFVASGRTSFLTVLKRFGPGNAGLLSFPFEGYTLTLDLPVTDDLPNFVRGLDELIVQRGGRVYLAKDALLAPETFAVMYPRLGEFLEVKRSLDPLSKLSSTLARRLGMISE
jgi:decaprenylphospho-beta-D-ribofuranose 2-oxidase